MSKIKIYLAGAMTHYFVNQQYYKATAWRERIKSVLEDVDVEVFDPAASYWGEEEDDGFFFDLYTLKKSSLVIVKFSDYGVHSVGTDMELALAHEYQIPIIAINETGHSLHTWQTCCINREFTDEDQAIEYACSHYIYN